MRCNTVELLIVEESWCIRRLAGRVAIGTRPPTVATHGQVLLRSALRKEIEEPTETTMATDWLTAAMTN